MRISNGILVVVLVMTWGLVFCGADVASGQNDPIDMQKARKLQQRFKAGEALTQEEQDYLNRARELRQPQRDRSPANAPPVKMPRITEEVCPVTELRVSETSYAAVRKPPGQRPFPAVIFLHGGLGQTSMDKLRDNALNQPTQTRFLAWGYVIVSGTRRAIRHDPLDRGVVTDTLALVEQVQALPEVDPDSVVLYGGSGGGTLALEVASVSDKVAAIAAGEPATIIYMGMFTKDHVVRDKNGKITGDRRWDVMHADPRVLYTDELKQYTRKKMAGIECPVLILHGDQHALKKFNFEVFVPELEALDKKVVVETYPGENHGFYWGRSKNPIMPLKANRDADAFFKKYIHVPLKPIDEKHVKMVLLH